MACEKKKPCLVAEKTEKKSEVLENMENPDEALSFESLLLTQNDEKRVTFGSAGGSVQCTEDWKNWVSLILSNQTRFQTKQWMELFEIGMRERERERNGLQSRYGLLMDQNLWRRKKSMDFERLWSYVLWGCELEQGTASQLHSKNKIKTERQRERDNSTNVQ